jgi:phage replication O-like protein O
MIPYTPIPNTVIDAVMPMLRDTEWRVLCVILRTTAGWSAPGGRKRQDWLTNGQFRKRTGRSSEAVSKAIDSLVRHRLIVVSGSGGQVLATPAVRRRYQGCLLFEVCPGELSTFPLLSGNGVNGKRKPESRNNKRN